MAWPSRTAIRFSATVTICLRAAAAVLALLGLMPSPRPNTLSKRTCRRLPGSTSHQPAASASALSRTTSCGTCGGTACSMSKDFSTRDTLPSAPFTSNQALRAGPSTATSAELNARSMP
ncbi:hypothetical protein G6F59_017672 [Rhizopus arrhizus]|nr:hypothetical protein G6F59_017672 [Rhizopus arrhizus]